MEKIEVIKYKFFSSAVADIVKAISGGALTGGYILSFCCIDYLGLALHPEKKNTKSDFIEYLEKYLGKLNTNYIKYSDHLYAIRCSLVHSYGSSDATKRLNFIPHLLHSDDLDTMHFDYWSKDKKLYISLPDFVAELISSIVFFFNVNTDENQYREWSSKLFYDSSLRQFMKRSEIRKTGSFKFSDIHPIFDIIDRESDIYLINENLKENFKNIIMPNV